jgi:proteasome lid subunit RPN8/RPN11
MPPPAYRYFYAVTRSQGGSSLGQFPAKLDLGPVVEWGRFTALRCWPDPERAAEAEPRIAPIWHATSGQPYVEGLRVTVRAKAMPTITADIPRSFFRPSAMRLGDTLVAQKKLESGELFTYAVLAFLASEDKRRQAPDPLQVEELPVPTALTLGSINDEFARSVAFGEVGSGLMPVFVPQVVMDEALALAERAGPVEAGAVLIGKMCRDAGSRELFLKVTAQIPARHALSASAKLSFTAETWAAVQAALELRRAGEQWVGWLHNHPGAPYWCKKDCAPEAKLKCAFNTPFFSSEDCNLHRVAFSPAHCVALLITNTFAGMKTTMYGWDRAQIVQRGYHITQPDAARALPVPAAASIIGSDVYETSCNNS